MNKQKACVSQENLPISYISRHARHASNDAVICSHCLQAIPIPPGQSLNDSIMLQTFHWIGQVTHVLKINQL